MVNILKRKHEDKDLDNLLTISRREQIYRSLSQDRVSHWKSTLFEVFIWLDSTNGRLSKTSKLESFLNYSALIIRKFQLLSLILLDYDLSASATLLSIFNMSMIGIRFDALATKLNGQTIYLVALLSNVYLWGFFVLLLYCQFYFKKNIQRKVVIVCAQITGWLCEYILLIPYIYTTTLYIKYSLISYKSVTEYGDMSSDDLDWFFILPLIFGAVIFQFLLYFRLIYSCHPTYSIKHKRSRMYSFATLKDIFVQEIIIVLSLFRFKFYFEMICSILCLYMISQYAIYFPFVTVIDNVFEASTFVLLIFGMISYIIADSLNALYTKTLFIILVFPFIIFLFYYAMNWFFNKVNNCPLKDPYSAELEIRKIINKRINSFGNDAIEDIKSIFTEITKKFLSFKLIFIWECIFTLHFRHNKSLALLKLSKINLSCPEHLKIYYSKDRQISRYYSCPNLECEFLFYFYYKKLINEEKSEDLALLRYLKDISELKDLDLDVFLELWNIYQKLSSISKHPANEINKACERLIDSKQKLESRAEKLIKKYQTDSDLLEIYGSYMSEFLKEERGDIILAKSRALKEYNDIAMEKIMGFKFEKGASIMVVSGMFGSIGDILYLNNEILHLLELECIDDYIGTSFIQFIPAPFDIMHNDILRKFLIFGDKIELYRPHQFLITSQGHCVEVSMHFRLVFYKQIPYFIADFNPRGHRKNLILHSPDGYIYAVSKEIQKYIGNREGTIFEILKNFIYYYEKYEIGECFEYNEEFSWTMMRFRLTIDGYALEVLYIADSNEAITPLDESPKLKYQNKSYNETTHLAEFSIENEEISLKNHIVSSNAENSTVASKKRIQIRTESANKRILAMCKVLNMNIRIALAILFAVTFTTIFLENNFVSSLKLYDMLNQMALMRYLGNSVLVNIRSLDLLSQGFETSSSEAYYRNLAKVNSNTLQENLMLVNDKLTSYSFFHDVFYTKVSLSEKIDNSIRITDENLFHCIQRYVSHVNAIVNTKLEDFHTIPSDFYFVYYNFPTIILHALNDSVYTTSTDFKEHVEDTFRFLKLFKIAFFIPPIIIIILSLPSIIVLEKINKTNWHSLSHLNADKRSTIRYKLIDRLHNLHGIDVNNIKLKSSGKENYSPIWKSFIIKILSLQVISIIYYFAVSYGFEADLSETFIYESKYIFNHGLRRMLSANSYFWAREKFLDSVNSSFINWLDNNKLATPSFSVKLESVTDEYEFLIQTLSYGKYAKFYNDDMIELEFGNPCKIIGESITNCDSSYISAGTVPAMKIYLEDLRGSSIYSQSNWKNIKKLEVYSSLIVKSAQYMMFNYLNATESNIENTIANLTIATVFYFISIVFASIILMLGAVNKIKKELIGKIEILKFFRN
ncbi:unnamed protein product [Blepharisma stoltei]|uniref:Uncharacterized protein n=1 Tax=Blepharisma stoltei TaxID=1481888 RepID=A0AAU9JK62_9CILI|nr:unnamed protein product [Blepharisma stoltei]